MLSLTTLPPELLNLILTHLIIQPTLTATSQHILHSHPFASLNALSTTCRHLHSIIKPMLFVQYIRRSPGDDIGLVYFVRSILACPDLGARVLGLQINDNGCISLPLPYSEIWATPGGGDPWWVRNGNELRPSQERKLRNGEGGEGWEAVPGCERSVDAKGRGTVFARARDGWGSFACLGEEDWIGGRLMNEREWMGLERKVYEVCESRAWRMGKGEDLSLSAEQWGKKMAAQIEGLRYINQGDLRMGIRSVETEGQGKKHERLHAAERFGLKFVKRLKKRQQKTRRGAITVFSSPGGWSSDDGWEEEYEDEDGWRLDEVPHISNPHTERIIARRWLRALRRGSRDAWSALLLVLAPGARMLMATEVNWFTRPDPHHCQYSLDTQQIANIEARYEEEDDEWEALGGYTWVGRVLYQCAADQWYHRALLEYRHEKSLLESLRPPSKKRKRADPPAFGTFSRSVSVQDDLRILPNIKEVILGSSTNPAHHPNLSLNTLLHFLQPPSVSHATVYGLSNATFGQHERKPPGNVQSRYHLRFLILNNCHASAQCLGYLMNKFPHLQTLTHRNPLRTIYKPSILLNLVPAEFIRYLADYCPWLRTLDLDAGNQWNQHALDAYECRIKVPSFKRLQNLEWLSCRVEHLMGVQIETGPEAGLIWTKDSDYDSDPEEQPLVLIDIMPKSLRWLTIGMDDEEYLSVMEPLAHWVGGMEKRGRGGETKLQLLRFMCGTRELREKFQEDARVKRVKRVCDERGIRADLGLLGE